MLRKCIKNGLANYLRTCDETDIDDILVWGTTTEEHDQRLEMALKRCEDIGLTLNKDKCVIGASTVTYIGYVLTPEGVKPGESKIKCTRVVI